MAATARNTIVGVFALVAIVLLAILVLAFGGGRDLLVQTYEVRVHFPQGVQGVQGGQSVTLFGKRIGETKAVEFADDRQVNRGVLVVLAVEDVYDIPASAEVTVVSSILGLGRPIISIEVPDMTDEAMLPHDDSAVIPGRLVGIQDQVIPKEIEQSLSQALTHLGRLAESLTPVAEGVARMLEARSIREVDLDQVTANLDTVVQRMDLALKSMHAVLGDADNQANLKQTLANFRAMSEKGVGAVESFEATMNDGRAMVAETGKLVARLAETADEISVMLASLNQTVREINEGDGTAALMLRDNRLYEEMVISIRRMTKTLDDLREVLDMAKRGELRIKPY